MSRFLLLAVLLGCAHAPAPNFVAYAETEPVAPAAPLALELEGEVSDESVFPLVLALSTAPDEVIIRIDSPGGSVRAGLSLVETMRWAQRHGTQITCVVDGWAASMAGYILMACDTRLMTKQSALMFHTVSIGAAPGGNQWDYERLVEQLRQINKLLSIFIAGRMNITLTEYEAHVQDRDWWVGYEEALKIGAVDGVL